MGWFNGIRGTTLLCALVAVCACSSPKSHGTSGGAGGLAGTAGATSNAGAAGGGATGGSSGSTLAALAETQAHALCTALFGCEDLRKDSSWKEILVTEAHCEQVWSEIFARMPEWVDLAALVDAGTVSIDPARESECMTLRGSCALGQALSLAACRAMFVGTVAPGGACRRTEECAGDAYCAAGGSSECPGTCTARKAPGDACTRPDECAAGSGYPRCVIDSQTGAGHCVSAELVSGVALGQSCAATDTTEPVCAPDLWCGGVGTDVETCQAPIDNGGACDNDFDVCVAGSFCQHPDTGPGTCQPLVIANTAGTSCGWDVGVFCDPFAGLDCQNTQCAPVLDGKTGSPCLGELSTTCGAGLGCLAGVCTALAADAAPCAYDGECVHGSCENGACAQYCAAR